MLYITHLGTECHILCSLQTGLLSLSADSACQPSSCTTLIFLLICKKNYVSSGWRSQFHVQNHDNSLITSSSVWNNWKGITEREISLKGSWKVETSWYSDASVKMYVVTFLAFWAKSKNDEPANRTWENLQSSGCALGPQGRFSLTLPRSAGRFITGHLLIGPKKCKPI